MFLGCAEYMHTDVCRLYYLLYLLVIHFESSEYLMEKRNFYAIQMYDTSMSFHHHVWVYIVTVECVVADLEEGANQYISYFGILV